MPCYYSNGGIDMGFEAISLFSGAGGLDMGFDRAGIKTIWANDIDHDACETHKAWSGAEVVEGDIGKVNFLTIPDADVILGGFPCQGFSLAGPRKIDDSRNILYRYFVKLVECKRPKIFVAENVKGLLTLGGGSIADAIINDFSEKGYKVTTRLVNAADYLVPQDRMRVIITGIREDLNQNAFSFPIPHGVKKTLRDALQDLPEANDDEICTAPFSSRYMSRNRKRDWDDVSFTIPAMAKQVTLFPGSPDMVHIGPDEWRFGEGGITRRLSYKEAAVIQTFPSDMVFFGDLTSKYKQIGNAVPVLLGEAVGNSVRKALEIWQPKQQKVKLLNMLV